MCINNGKRVKRINKGDPIPDGWVKGGLGTTTGRICVTNGVVDKKIKPGEPIPDGFWKGSYQKK